MKQGYKYFKISLRNSMDYISPLYLLRADDCYAVLACFGHLCLQIQFRYLIWNILIVVFKLWYPSSRIWYFNMEHLSPTHPTNQHPIAMEDMQPYHYQIQTFHIKYRSCSLPCVFNAFNALFNVLMLCYSDAYDILETAGPPRIKTFK